MCAELGCGACSLSPSESGQSVVATRVWCCGYCGFFTSYSGSKPMVPFWGRCAGVGKFTGGTCFDGAIGNDPNDLPGVGNEPEGDSLKGSHKGVFIGVILHFLRSLVATLYLAAG